MKGFARLTQWIGGYGWTWALGCWNPILYLFNHIRVLKYMVHRQPALKLLVYILNGQVLGLTRRHRHLVTVPVYPYTRAQDTWMSIRWHTDVTMVMAFFTTPGDGLGGNASHPQSTPHGSVFIEPGSPVLSSRMFMCPPIVVSIVSMWRSQNCSMRKNIFVVILSLPIISLKKTFLSPDIQTGWFMQSG